MARPDNPATVYLDSSAIIAAIKKEPGFEPVQRVLKARDLAFHYGLKGAADAVHLASAVVAGAEVFMATDDRFPYDQDVEGVWVSRPYLLGSPDLFTQDT